MEIDHAVKGVSVILFSDEILNSAEIVAEVHGTRWLDTGKDASHGDMIRKSAASIVVSRPSILG